MVAGSYSVTVTDVAGCQIVRSTTVNAPAPLTISNAGNSQVLGCGFNSLNLNANTATNGTGLWSVDSATNSQWNIDQPSNPNATFSAPEGTYILRWTISNSQCSNFSTVEIKFDKNCQTIDFDGVDDYINFGNSHALTNGNFSLEAWIKPHSITGNKTVYSKRNSNNIGSGGYDLRLSNGIPVFRWNGKSLSPSASAPLNSNRWYHIAISFNGQSAYMYVDGIQVGITTGNSPGSINSPFLIGGMNNNINPARPVDHFNGWIEEVRIWNAALSVDQIRFMMNQRLMPTGVNGGIKGVELPQTVPGELKWENLQGYYKLLNTEVTTGLTIDGSDSNIPGELKNIISIQQNTAPLPTNHG